MNVRSLPVHCLVLLGMVAMAAAAGEPEPVRLHPRNPHYFLLDGKPAVLIASTEHYGAVMNLDFDFIPYLDELRSRRLNLTRLFSGAMREEWGEPWNTLRPKPGRYVCRVPRGSSARALADPGKAYAIYVRGGTSAALLLELPAGSCGAEWIAPRTGAVEKTEVFDHPGGGRTLSSPAYREDVALRIRAAK